MLTRLRGLWRSARSLPLLRVPLLAADRFWWARTIRRADVVDVSYAGLQLGRRVSARAAVRAYVSGGFREGLTLNPLFAERLVSAQLPDSDRVPALYAYLVTDPARIETSLAWDAPAYATAHASGAGRGPLADAWLALRSGGAVVLRGGRSADLAALHGCAADVLSGLGPDASPVVPASSAVVMTWEVDGEDADGDGLRAPLAVLGAAGTGTDTDPAVSGPVALILAIADATPAVRLQASQLALGDPRVLLHDRTVSAAETAGDAVLVRRTPGALITASAIRALITAAHSAPTAPVWLAPDGSIASAGLLTHDGAPYRALASHPWEDAQALGDVLPVAMLDAPVRASRAGAVGAPRTLLSATVLGPAPSGVALPPAPAAADDAPAPSPRGLRIDGWSRGAAPAPRYARAPERFVLPDGSEVPRLRWAIKTAAPAGPRGESWGETHFARALASALERHGQYVAVDARPALDRASSDLDDVVLSLRGPHPLPAPASAHTVLWIISHPDEITSAEVAGYDHVHAASTSWAATATRRFGVPVRPLLQCTDARRFAPSGLPRSADLVFVGTARGIARPSVVEPLRAGRPVRVYGPDWRGYIPGAAIAGTHVDNDDLPALYESAGAVLNDHWPAMRREGFVSNRLFDVVAAGGRAISDDVDGIADLFGAAVRTYGQIPELLALTSAPLDAKFCSDAELAEISRRIRTEHSFDARARALLDDVLTRG
ncbi:glycosyltransferase [Microbacterium sp. MYb64]|uniref:glycosyltransferase n=1 Tax=Microbacterium sp. MYb64 TaxID=1848691 RepID=UPI000CFBE8DC|nr:glycosyltransferase [Microbacterium sp. MYb64]PRB01261.1 hypothetical protein CQ044_17330 [Microbacterium sp. MYb64]